MSGPTFQASWNPKRQAVTYRIGKEGVRDRFLLFSIEDIRQLQTMIDEAVKGTDVSATG